MMINVILIFAILCGCAALLQGSRVAALLLVSLATTSGLTLASVPFIPLLWLAIDAVVIAGVVCVSLSTRNIAILSLFIPSWTMYVVQGPYASDVSTLAVSAQLIITLPLKQFWSRARQALRSVSTGEGFDLFASGEGQ